MQFMQFELADFTAGGGIAFGKCTVYLSGTGTLASLFDAAGSPISNPAIAGSNALIGFAAADGLYDFQFANADGSLNGPKIIKQQIFDLSNIAATTVATRTALAALTPAAGMARTLVEAAREGLFVFDGSNLSAKVTADTAQGIYVAPASATTGAAGAWIRKYSGPAMSSWFGLIGNGSDETTALTCFFNHAISSPGVPHFLEPKTYGISAALPTISVNDVIIDGSRGTFHNVGAVLSGTIFKWLGGISSGKMLTVTPPAGASNQFLTGIVLRGLGFDCNSAIAYGVRIESVRNCEVLLAGANATTTLFDLGVMSGALGEGRDMQGNIIRLSGRQVEAASGVCLQVGGDSTANVSFNDIWCEFLHKNAPAIVVSNADNNDWRSVKTATAGGGTATESVQLLGGATSVQRAREETFWHLSTDKALRVYGTSDGYTVASSGHRLLPDRDNGTPAPVIGTGAFIDCEYSQSYTPTVAGAVGGAGLSITSPTGTFIRQGCFCDAEITFTKAAGTGYQYLTVTLPFNCTGSIGYCGDAKERSTTGKLFSTFVDAASNSLIIQHVDGTTAIPDGNYNASIRYRVR